MQTPKDQKEHNTRVTKPYIRAILIAIVAVVFLFFGARSTDILKVEVNQMYVSGNAVSKRIAEESGSRGRQTIDGTDDLGTMLTLSGDLAIRASVGGSIGASTFMSDGKNDLEKAIAGKLRREGLPPLNVTVDSISTTGFYWTPIIKSGTTSFVVSVADSAYSAGFTGGIHVQTYGLSSSRQMQRAAIDRISYLVVKTVKTDMEKVNPLGLQ